MSFDILTEKISELANPTVMGLDPRLDFIPPQILEEAKKEYGETFRAAGEAIYTFNCGLIDAAAGLVPAVKPQSAFYEMYGLEGMRALERTVAYAKQAGMYVILDVKRSDIGTTAEAYAKAYIGTTALFGAEVAANPGIDCITVNPYLGSDGVKPFVDCAARNNKSLFVLVKTSNPSSAELQDIAFEGKPLYRHVAEAVERAGAPYIGSCGYSLCGAVAGATYPKQLAELREAMPHTFFLIPGYGAQGGSAADIAAAFDSRRGGAIVNSSRALMCAYKKQNAPENYKACTRAAVLEMKEDIGAVIHK